MLRFDTSLYCSYNNYADRVRSRQGCRQYRKHGVSLILAAEPDWDAALVWVDWRFEYDETRMIVLAPQTHTLYYVAFVDREDDEGAEVRRIISLRRATRNEVKRYVENS